MNARVKLVVLLLLAALWPSALWASDPAVTIVWPGTNSRGQVMLTLTTNAGTYTKTVPYGEGSTAASIASSFGAHISMSPSWPVYAKGYPNGTLKMKLKGNSSETITGIQVCVASSGTCVGSPSGTSFQTGSVLPAGPVLDDALYGFIIAKTDGSSGYDGVGNVVAYQDQVNQQWTASYDSLNRLKSASQTILPSQGSAFNIPGGTGVQQYFCWNYDSFGNRTSQIASGASFADTSSCQPSSSAYHNDTLATYDANNRITSGTGIASISYDPAGSLQDDGKYGYKYDGEGRLCAVLQYVTNTVTGYLYDAEGTRVAKGSVTSFDCPTTSNFTLTNQYIPGPDGQQMTELDGNGNWVHTNIFAGGSLIATDDTAGRHYQLNDWLGNRRMQVDPNGNVEATLQAAPYGDQLNPPPPLVTTEQYFTGKERDAESNLDYFGARYYGSSMGRFMSPDWSASPSAVPYASLADPQSMNLYAYAGNSPLGRADSDGHCPATSAGPDAFWGSCQPVLGIPGANTCSDASCVIEKEGAAYDKEVAAAQQQTTTQQGSGPASLALLQTGPVTGNPIVDGGIAVEQGVEKALPAIEEEAPIIAQEAVSVYQKANQAYVGITKDLARRATQHKEALIPIVQGLSRWEARAVEQTIINMRGLENLANKINSISVNNAEYEKAIQFGRELLGSIGFK